MSEAPTESQDHGMEPGPKLIYLLYPFSEKLVCPICVIHQEYINHNNPLEHWRHIHKYLAFLCAFCKAHFRALNQIKYHQKVCQYYSTAMRPGTANITPHRPPQAIAALPPEIPLGLQSQAATSLPPLDVPKQPKELKPPKRAQATLNLGPQPT